MKTSEADALARLLDGDPAAADGAPAELRSLAALAQAMETRAAAPRPDFRDSLREALFTEAAKPAPPTLVQRAAMAVDDALARVRYSARAAAATSVAALTLSSGGVAVAAVESVPGDLFYPVKIAVEDMRLGMADGAASRGELLLSFTESRIAEAERAAEAGRADAAEEALLGADAALREAASELIGAYQDTGDRAALVPLERLRDASAERLTELAALLDGAAGRALVALETSFERITQRIAAVTGECCVAATEDGETAPGIPRRGEAFDFGHIPAADEPFEPCPCPASAPATLPDVDGVTPMPTPTPTPTPTPPTSEDPDEPDPTEPPPSEPPPDEPGVLPEPIEDAVEDVDESLDDAVDPVRDAVEDVIGDEPDLVPDALQDPVEDAVDSVTEPLP